MTDNVVVLLVIAGKRDNDTVFQPLGHSSRSLAYEAADDIGLLEVRLVGVEDDRLSRFQLVVEQLGVAFVPSFGHATAVRCRFQLLGIVVNFEVFGLERLELKTLVLDFVSAEVLRRRINRQIDWQKDENKDCPPKPFIGRPVRTVRVLCHTMCSIR